MGWTIVKPEWAAIVAQALRSRSVDNKAMHTHRDTLLRAFDALPPLKSLAIRAARGQALAGAHALTHDAASRPGA